MCRWQQRLADSPTLDAPITLVPATRLTDTGPMVLRNGPWQLELPAGASAGWLADQPVDMRPGIDGLSLLIQQATGHSPCDGAACAFRDRRSNRIKLLVWDGAGVWLCHRRLHTGRFKWPAAGDTTCPLASEQW